MNLIQIKAALAANMPVHWSNAGYVVKGNLITCTLNTGGAVGLTWADGVTLNGKEKDFFIGECDELRDFISGYSACLGWASSCENGAISKTTQLQIKNDCRAFVSENIVDLLEYAERRADCMPSPWLNAGHDFWLTRCGHGAGFWDRGLGELGDRLSEAARVCGSLDPYIGDNGEVWL